MAIGIYYLPQDRSSNLLPLFFFTNRVCFELLQDFFFNIIVGSMEIRTINLVVTKTLELFIGEF